jgi:predicted ester cyclase
LIRKLIEAVDRAEPLEIGDYYAEDYLDHHSSPGRSQAEGSEGMRIAFDIFYKAFPDTRHTIHHLFASDDRVVAHMSAVATHTGEILGIPPTGMSVNLESIAIYRIDGGKIAERWCFQSKGILDQLREGSH